MGTFEVIAAAVLVVGGLNRGLWGAFEVDLMALLFGGNVTFVSTMVFLAVGTAALNQALGLRALQQRWGFAPACA